MFETSSSAIMNIYGDSKKSHIFLISDLVRLLCITSETFSILTAFLLSFCLPDSITFDSILYEDQGTGHGKITNCKLLVTDTDV